MPSLLPSTTSMRSQHLHWWIIFLFGDLLLLFLSQAILGLFDQLLHIKLHLWSFHSGRCTVTLLTVSQGGLLHPGGAHCCPMLFPLHASPLFFIQHLFCLVHKYCTPLATWKSARHWIDSGEPGLAIKHWSYLFHLWTVNSFTRDMDKGNCKIIFIFLIAGVPSPLNLMLRINLHVLRYNIHSTFTVCWRTDWLVHSDVSMKYSQGATDTTQCLSNTSCTHISIASWIICLCEHPEGGDWACLTWLLGKRAQSPITPLHIKERVQEVTDSLDSINFLGAIEEKSWLLNEMKWIEIKLITGCK